MKDADLIRWAAKLCEGWSSTGPTWVTFGGAPMFDSEARDWDAQLGVRALAYDLLARFIEATPNPQWEVNDGGAGYFNWLKIRLAQMNAIAESPIACIRAIHESGVLTDDA